jgi:DnaJ-domain-containing protein 1
VQVRTIPGTGILENYKKISMLGPCSGSGTQDPKPRARIVDTIQISQEAREKSRLLIQANSEEQVRQGQLRRDQDQAIRKSFEVLEVGVNTPSKDLKKAYYHLMRNYHPDKYSHLPPEFRELAEAKAKQIVAAYRKLTA